MKSSITVDEGDGPIFIPNHGFAYPIIDRAVEQFGSQLFHVLHNYGDKAYPHYPQSYQFSGHRRFGQIVLETACVMPTVMHRSLFDMSLWVILLKNDRTIG